MAVVSSIPFSEAALVVFCSLPIHWVPPKSLERNRVGDPLLLFDKASSTTADEVEPEAAELSKSSESGHDKLLCWSAAAVA